MSNFDVDHAMRQARAAMPPGANIDWAETRRRLERLAAFQFVPLSEAPFEADDPDAPVWRVPDATA